MTARSHRIANRPHLYSLATIIEMLAARAADLAADLFPNGRREGAEWLVHDLSGAPGDNLSICIHGPKAGVWKNFASSEKGGDAFDLVTMAVCGGDKSRAVVWAKTWLGLEGGDPAVLRATRHAVEQKRKAPTVDQDAKAKKGAAYRIWQAAQPKIAGTVVERYLAARGLHIARLDFPVTSLRYMPQLAARVKDLPPPEWPKFPAMIAPIFDFKGNFLGAHRTWLWEEGQPGPGYQVAKAPIEKPKKVLGLYKGGFIPLWRGVAHEATTGEIRLAPALNQYSGGVWVDLTEGIEDGLTVVLADPSLRVYVGVALASMAAIQWPPQVAGITIWQQNDPPDSQAAAAFAKVVENYQRQGKRIRLARPPAHAKDANELVQQQQKEGAA